MLWLTSVKVLFAIAGMLLVSIWVALVNDEFGWAIGCGVVAAPLLMIAHRRIQQLCEHEERYKNVTFYCLRESQNVWSTHIGGVAQRPVMQLGRRLKALLWRSSGMTAGIKLVLSAQDAAEVRRRSLDCFARKLDQLAVVENAVLITASVLNDPARGNRLQLRIQEIEKRPEWCYQLIERKLGIFEILTGRVLYGWTFPGGSGWRPYVPGLIAWRKVDKVPKLQRLNARPRKICGTSILCGSVSRL